MTLSPLISPASLMSQLNAAGMRIIDTRFSLADTELGRRNYTEGHIPGALYAHLDEDLSGPILPNVTGRHPLPDPAAFAQRLSSWGIDLETEVVIYDDMGGAIAARLWWMLRWMGHGKARVLDGGWQAWLAEGGASESEKPAHAPKQFTGTADASLIMEADAIEAAMAEGSIVLVDSRAHQRYLGEVEPIDPVAGHIPGAQNIPFKGNLNDGGRFLTQEALQERFAGFKDGTKPVVFYCGSGVTAAHNLLAMEYAGLGLKTLYPGSWSGWIVGGKRAIGKG